MSTNAALPPHRQARLINILRRANDHYHSVAVSVRGSLAPTHHARKRAHRLGLSVSVEKAVACPQTQVSHIPLPVLDASVDLTEGVARAASEAVLRRRPAMKGKVPTIIIPAREQRLYDAQQNIPSVSARHAPVVLRGDGVVWRGPTSRFSLSPSNENAKFRIHGRPLPDVPVDEDLSEGWSDDDSESEEDGLDDDDLPSIAGTSSSSSGPATPKDSPPLMIRIKRKSMMMEVDPQEEKVHDSRPPKFIRKDWMQSRSTSYN